MLPIEERALLTLGALEAKQRTCHLKESFLSNRVPSQSVEMGKIFRDCKWPCHNLGGKPRVLIGSAAEEEGREVKHKKN